MIKPILKYEIIEEPGLIVRYLKGQIDLTSLFSLMLKSVEDKRYSKNFGVLYDIRDAEFVVRKESIKDFLGKVRGNSDMVARKRVAFLTMNPNQVVFSSLLNRLAVTGLFSLHTFSTLPSALSFLNVDSSFFQEVENTLQALKGTDD
ncbi:hypothetical protein BY457_104102 [Marinilabilia salmonicolor]|jgi:hypothetical protein|uniref:hypothetical protein n=1 Tax=Marinilabilia salmonicolor TaxID=989 RepID=UPI000D057939|nr:hypothetical protein [Marinilabilia salmonicolor]PRZ00904.1 hypothetical protein BY457_104102 [Marinilabilia salmonicolor]